MGESKYCIVVKCGSLNVVTIGKLLCPFKNKTQNLHSDRKFSRLDPWSTDLARFSTPATVYIYTVM